MLKNLFKKFNTVEVEEVFNNIVDSDELVRQIHTEVDSLEEQYNNELEEILNSLKIPSEDKVLKKAELMKSLGFSNSNETIIQSSILSQEITSKKDEKISYESSLKLLKELKLAYPKDKIIPLKEFNKVLDKYNLIYAPTKNYIKDVPEKNLLEIASAKPVSNEHQAPPSFNLVSISFGQYHSKEYQKAVKELLNNPNTIFPLGFDFKYTSDSEFEALFKVNNFKYIDPLSRLTVKNYSGKVYAFIEVKFEKFHRNDLFIAAPKSHFNLEDLKENEKGYFRKEIIEVKDPIAFYILKGDFVRIVSKWGTSDDQSYLDPMVNDERNN